MKAITIPETSAATLPPVQRTACESLAFMGPQPDHVPPVRQVDDPAT